MICLIILIGVAMIVVGFIIYRKDYDIYYIFYIIGGFLIVVTIFVALMDTIPNVIEAKVINDKIIMYEKENAQIEEDVEQIVAQYQQHEKEVFDMSEIHSATTLIQMYPDLKSNDLAMKQIEIYNKNNAQIKSLKLDQIDCEKAKWWLYFGKVGE